MSVQGMSVFIRPGSVCAADQREVRFDNAFDRANSLVLYSPLPVGLGQGGLSRRTLPGDAACWGQMALGQYEPQRNNTVMTPNGHIWFPEGLFREDFSSEDAEWQHLFMHEMVHVWQRQMGMHVLLRGLLSWAARYKYTLSVKKKLANYGMEQQASLLADYCILTVYGYAVWNNLRGCKNPGSDILSVYKLVLSDFLKNPADRSVL